MHHTRIVLFLRAPEKGKVKTRLARRIGEDMALDLYRCFAEDVLAALEKSGHPIEIHYCPETAAARQGIRDWLGETHPLIPQRGNDLGERDRKSVV